VIEIACAVEGDYVPHLAAMLDSVLENRGDLRVRVHCLHGPDFDDAAGERLSEMLAARDAELSLLSIPDGRVEGLPTQGFTGKATWYRLFLSELLPDLDRVLYLDADLLALDSIVPLWQTPLGDHYLAAVTNVFMTYHRHRPRELGLSGPESYFNAGVLLFNLGALRADDQAERMVRYARTHAHLLEWRDQDTLNVALGERRIALHPRWNCMNAMLFFPEGQAVFGAEEYEEARRNPAIRHYEGPGPNKPWHYLSDPAAQDAYRRHRRQTPWPEVRLEGRTPLNAARKLRTRLGR
jgi:lipopolysaccharide biosynthesis glycosyltransferase